MIGRRLLHYELTAKLGEGGMGAVYEAEDSKLGRPVALKVLPPELAEDPERLARFQREARAVAALNHPNIVVLHSVEESDGTHFLTMERVEGRPLSEVIPPDGLPIDRLLEIGIALADAIAAAHDRGITHRDLKPANVMITSEGRVKVLDFGLAKLTEEEPDEDGTQIRTASLQEPLTGEGKIVGTVSYMAPEQAEGKVVDSRTDVFAFGVILYQMATGRRPFAGDTSASTMAKILEARPEPPSIARPDLPGDLERIIGRCLEKRPADRYNDTRDLLADLRYLEQSGDSQSAVTPAAPVARPRAPWILLAVLALAAVTLLVIRPWSVREPAASSEVAVAAAKPSVAVLPFHNLSGEEENDYFSAGMTEEIISKLSRLDGLEVASRSSVAPFTDRARDVQQIGRDLEVRYILDGSVRRAGDRVRVSAQLVDGSTGRNLWSDDFDGSLEDVFAMQEQTALTIANQLDLELSPEEQRALGKRLTENVAAYDAYLRGMALSRQWGEPGKLELAIAAFKTALDHDPEFAAALAGLAFVESDMYRTFDSSEERLERAESYAQRAVELEPTLPEASHALAMVAGNRYDYHRAAELLRQTVRLAPKEPRFWDNLSWALAYQIPPDVDGSIEAARKALQLQPIFPGAYYHLGRALLARGDLEQAKDAFERCLEQSPDASTGHLGLAQYHLASGEYDAALREMDVVGAKTSLTFFYLAAIHAASGDREAALRDLESSLEKGFRDFVTLDASPYLASLRDDSAYQALLDRYRDSTGQRR
jgi:serine/threonine protein kinase/tetratricopeptide (TPR) repeat protein